MIAIDKNIPIPPKWRKGKFDELLKKMEIGDSFFLPGVNYSRVTGIFQAAKHLGMKVTSRTNEEGVRIWRIA